MKTVTTPVSIKTLDENNILHVQVIEGAHIDIEGIVEDHKICRALIGDRKVAALFDARAFFTITAEARNFAKENISDARRIATAVLADNIAVKILTEGYIRINRPACPVQLFNSKSEAMGWLKSFQEVEKRVTV